MKRLRFIAATLAFFMLLSGAAKSQLIGPVVSLTGNVFNEVTKQPVTAFLIVLDETGKRVAATRSNSAENGYYYITGLKPGKTYKLSLKQKEFLSEDFDLVIPQTDKYQEISRDFLVKPMEKNAQLKLAVPPFELNKSKLRFGSEDVLDDYVSTLKSNPTVKFNIVCFPDNDNDKSLNQSLTSERAQSIKDYFQNKGIDASRLSIVTNPGTDPKNPPPTKKMAKGKRYIGSTYLVISEI